MSKHISLWNACYKSIVSTRNKKYLAKCKSMFLCGHAPWDDGAGHVRIRSAAMPCMCISEKEISSRGHLAICVYVYDYTNNIIVIIMCIGLVHGIFMGNI